MSCINPDGTLTVVSRKIVEALETAHSFDTLQKTTDLPTYRLRASLRELSNGGLLEQLSDQSWIRTELGVEALEISDLPL